MTNVDMEEISLITDACKSLSNNVKNLIQEHKEYWHDHSKCYCTKELFCGYCDWYYNIAKIDLENYIISINDLIDEKNEIYKEYGLPVQQHKKIGSKGWKLNIKCLKKY